MIEPQFSFVILHYLDYETTVACVESILNNLCYHNYKIIIVDNASPNQSGEKINNKYQNNDKIKVILRNKNDGFANGNNAGYIYAKEFYDAEFVICINNDTILTQNDFLQRIVNIYREKKCDILGPNIRSKDGTPQSPRRLHRLTYKDVKKNILKKRLVLLYLYWKKYLFRIKLIDNMYEKSNMTYKQNIDASGEKEDVVLLGACIIYCPEFVKNEKFAFSPKTFMYGEEDLLALYCNRKNYKTLFSPMLEILHLGEVSTKNANSNEVNKQIFLYTYVLEGLKLLKCEMGKSRSDKNCKRG